MKFPIALFFLANLLVSTAFARDIAKEIERAERFGREASPMILRNEILPYWAHDGSRLVYRVDTGRDSHQFFALDLKTGTKSPAFDHVALAKSLAAATSRTVNPDALPLENVEPEINAAVLRFRAFGQGWRFDAAKLTVSPDKVPPKVADLKSPEDVMQTDAIGSGPTSLTIENGTAGEIELFWVPGRGERKSYGKVPPGGSSTQSTYSGHAWVIGDSSGTLLAGVVAKDLPSIAHVTGRIESTRRKRDEVSPDGKWRALIRNHNLSIEPTGGGAPIALTEDGTRKNRYAGPIQWSPDSQKLTAFRTKEVEPRVVQIVQSSPPDQVQPKLKSIRYPKPGDEISQSKPRLFDIANRREIPIANKLFDNPWSIDELAWSPDSSEFSFLYNQRGHQVMRIVAIRADSGSARVILEERSKTFIDYSQKTYLHRLTATRELLWASERDGYNHLYLIDEVSGQIKNQITTGNWNVREVIRVDENKQQLLLKVVGMPGSDPYYNHFVRVNFDGSGFTRLTRSDGHHSIEFSPDGAWIIAKWSRVDQPQVVEVRNAEDGKLLAELERADDSELRKKGWNRPERFVAKGRDGTMDIHGIIIRPTGFDPTKKYPVVEDIYAGPHDHFVQKNHLAWSRLHAMAEFGFIVVSIDGMGTNWRNKAFHDVAWKNLAESGFPDRIAWLKAAAATRPWMDLGRVGIYGGSAGGQSALAGLLHHGDFYKVGVADCGCHDNRMDKIWWNEAWMGWPVDESYARNSNVTHAGKLTGKLMLIVGELDENVDPASTAQVVAALQKAGKNFDFVPVMNAGHGAAETPYGRSRRAEFLTNHLRGPE